MKSLLATHALPTFYCPERKGNLVLLRYGPFLTEVIERNMSSIIKYSTARKASDAGTGPHVSDFKIPPFEAMSEGRNVFHLVINTDGVNIVKSKSSLEFYPVWIALAELPPRLRQSYRNIVLAALWCGDDKPDWGVVFTHLKKELWYGIDYSVNGTVHNAFVEPIVLVADMIAKASVLNMIQCNGYYGCNLCTHPGVHVRGAHVYDFDVPAPLRTTQDYSECVSRSIDMMASVKYNKNTRRLHPSLKGIKGPSLLGK